MNVLGGVGLANVLKSKGFSTNHRDMGAPFSPRDAKLKTGQLPHQTFGFRVLDNGHRKPEVWVGSSASLISATIEPKEAPTATGVSQSGLPHHNTTNDNIHKHQKTFKTQTPTILFATNLVPHLHQKYDLLETTKHTSSYKPCLWASEREPQKDRNTSTNRPKGHQPRLDHIVDDDAEDERGLTGALVWCRSKGDGETNAFVGGDWAVS